MQVLVIGFARSGAAVAKLLQAEGAKVTVSDPKLDLDDPKVKALAAKGVTFTKDQDPSLLTHVDLIVKNPGIPYWIPILKAGQAAGIPIEVEVARAQKYIQGPWIAVTGSNGKTTTTKMIAAVLKANAKDPATVKVAGNIGLPVSELVPTLKPTDTVVTELSSFQLLGLPAARPHIAVITNIFSSHLDFHGSREAYISAKLNITRHQLASDFLVLNFDRQEWRDLAKETAAQVIPTSRKGLSHEGAYQEAGWLYFKEEAIMPVLDLGVPGEHNIENALNAIAVGKLSGVPTDKIAQALSQFQGVRHRLQKVGKITGRLVYNDSKATDIEATESALSGFKQPIVLLAGGLDRGDDEMRLLSAVQGKVKQLIVFGQTAPKLIALAKAAGIPVVQTQDVQTAVPLAFAKSQPGDVILLSPAAASWDQYPSFEKRGDLFIDAVEQYAQAAK
ncbi:UDP-N-acetylmuramoyl-L-alanine--D-glutamate ligase [Weissella halotolerans]|uniref:UDP-N-acetylmuramoyl-L-alanine--D-glutamate ligase n=3 Tax=Weissella halotolerans TaxID=1615 RepID=UPI0003B58510|nr:UDP-N-acetylmuramoyl-L-alanine--D-glutamate ligase [Weissella halotolerans]